MLAFFYSIEFQITSAAVTLLILYDGAAIRRVHVGRVEVKLQWSSVVQQCYLTSEAFLHAFLFIFERFNSALVGFKFVF